MVVPVADDDTVTGVATAVDFDEAEKLLLAADDCVNCMKGKVLYTLQ